MLIYCFRCHRPLDGKICKYCKTDNSDQIYSIEDARRFNENKDLSGNNTL